MVMLEGYFNFRQCFMANDRKQAIITSFLFFRFPSFSQARGPSKSYLSVKHPIFRVRLELMLGPFFCCRTLTSGDMPSDLHSKFMCDSSPVNLSTTNSRNRARSVSRIHESYLPLQDANGVECVHSDSSLSSLLLRIG